MKQIHQLMERALHSCARCVCNPYTLVNWCSGALAFLVCYLWSVNTHSVKAYYGNAGVLWYVLLLVLDNKWHVGVDSVFQFGNMQV